MMRKEITPLLDWLLLNTLPYNTGTFTLDVQKMTCRK